MHKAPALHLHHFCVYSSRMGWRALVLCLCWGLGTAIAASPTFHEVHYGGPAAAASASSTAGRVMHSDSHGSSRKTVEFRDSSWSNCAAFGCSDECSATDSFLQTQLTCGTDSSDYGYEQQQSTFLAAVGPQVGSCTWEFRPFSTPWPLYLISDGVTERRGTARGTCTFADHGVEQCSQQDSSSSSDPKCNGAVITIEAGWYETPAWWASDYLPPIHNDRLDEGKPSCCVMEYADVISGFPGCDSRRLSKKQQPAAAPGNTTSPPVAAPGNITSTPPAAAANKPASKRLLAEGGPAKQVHAAVADYNGRYSGSYSYGKATVISGPMTVVNSATGEQWEDTGLMQWVPAVRPSDLSKSSAPNNIGSPSPDLLHVQPGSYRFQFKQKAFASARSSS